MVGEAPAGYGDWRRWFVDLHGRRLTPRVEMQGKKRASGGATATPVKSGFTSARAATRFFRPPVQARGIDRNECPARRAVRWQRPLAPPSLSCWFNRFRTAFAHSPLQVGRCRPALASIRSFAVGGAGAFRAVAAGRRVPGEFPSPSSAAVKRCWILRFATRRALRTWRGGAR